MAKKGPQIVTEQAIALVAKEAEQSLVGLDPLPKRLAVLKMTSDRDYEILMDEGRKVREIQRGVEEKQKSLTGLCDKLKRDIRSLFAPMISSCQTVLKIVDQKQHQYDKWRQDRHGKEQERLRLEAEAEQRRLEANARRRAARREDPAEAREILCSVPQIAPLELPEPMKPRVDGVSIAKVWDFEILIEADVPKTIDVGGVTIALWTRAFDRKALLECQRAGYEIPGVRFFQKEITRYGRL